MNDDPTIPSDLVRSVDFRSGVYRHYKGEHYLTLGLARVDENNDTAVVYVRLYNREGIPMNTRLLSKWKEYVDPETGEAVHPMARGGVPRFQYVGDRTPGRG